MEVKNPLFKEDFVSSSSISASCLSSTSMPPAYATIITKPEILKTANVPEQTNLVQINETAVEMNFPAVSSEKNEGQ